MLFYKKVGIFGMKTKALPVFKSSVNCVVLIIALFGRKLYMVKLQYCAKVLGRFEKMCVSEP